ncbi:MAG: biosynthetic-type acetolactate synthase large subunit [Methanoregula sp.]|nr:biosynthetic-type acetolactate synthase large subunit [Methanoregula sp.]
MKSGAKILIGEIERQGVSTLFGYPGATVLPIYDELWSSHLTHILVRHEPAAAHAADGYARASGRTGVCVATSGPGACNLVTGIATAYMDSSPVVAITGQVPTTLLGNDAFQEADITGIMMPVTKHGYLVRRTEDLRGVIREAFHLAGTGRKGPVLVDIPKDVSANCIEDDEDSGRSCPGIFPVLRGYRPQCEGHRQQVQKAARAIAASERPLIYAGGGIIAAGASGDLVRLAGRLNAPVTTTLMALGAVPFDHPLFLGMPGMHGTPAANYAIHECDLLLAVGVRFDDRVTGNILEFAPHARVVHIDIDPAEIGKNHAVDIPIVGDAGDVLRQLFAFFPKDRAAGAWNRRITEWKTSHPLRYRKDGLLHPQFVIKTLSDLTRGKAVIVSDVGQHQMWTARHYGFCHPRNWITSGGLGTMGFALPAAIGAQLARPGEQIISIAGDGGFQMNIQELATIAQYRLPVKMIVLNNRFLGMVRQWQELFCDRRYSCTELPQTDFSAIAKAYGIDAVRVESCDEVLPVLREALLANGPVLVDCIIEREDNVYPMVPAGAGIHEMLGIEEP